MKKTILITGATSGLGFSLATKLAQNHNLVICGRDGSKTYKLAKELDCEYFVADLSDFQSVQKLGKEITEKIKNIDVLVNNAGLWAEGPIDNYSSEQIMSVMAVNLTSGIILTKAIVGIMKRQGHGLIINVISQAALHAKENRTLYKATKYGLRGFNDSLKLELMPHNIRVTGFYPGTMKTPLFEKGDDPKNLEKALSADEVADILEYIINAPKHLLITEFGVRPINA